MYFKKLEMYGFKSFADKTALNFEEGITAVVGPNGCGKSNVFDSIRWVLGEQSAKELRGSSMEDIIFNGTQNMPALGFAEVSLSFSNLNRALPIEYDEVVITRRLYRSGESEYLLNKTKVRLKDIHELLYGTGIGKSAYSMIQQGKVDQVVSAKPEERRLIFDEASGITKYKAKKKEALSKLKSADDNLLRVNDITVEVKRQISSIERQANKARKYKDEFDKLKALEIQVAQYQMSSFVQRRERIEESLEECRIKEARFNQETEELSQRLSEELNALSEIEQRINEIRSQEIKLDSEIDQNNQQIGFNQERMDGIDENKIKMNEQKATLIERCRLQQEKVEDLKQNLSLIAGGVSANEEALKEKQNELISIERSTEEAERKILDDEEKIVALTSNQVQLRNQLTDVMKDIQGSLARRRRLELEIEKIKNTKQEREQRLQNVGYQINAVSGSIQDIVQQRSEKEKTIGEIKDQLKTLNQHIDEQEKQRLFLQSQKEFIEQMTAQYQEMPDPVIEGKLITHDKPEDYQTGIIGKVKSVRSHKEGLRLFSFLKKKNNKLFEIICETKFIELDPIEISKKIDVISDAITTLNFQREEIEDSLKAERAELDILLDEYNKKEKTFSVLEAQKNDTQEEAQKLGNELQQLETEYAESKQYIDEIKKKEEELNYELDTINQDIGWCQNDIKEKRSWINGKMKQREEVTVSIAQSETKINAERQKLIDHQANCEHLQDSLDNWLQEIKNIDDELSKTEQQKEVYFKESEELELRIQSVRHQKEETKQQLIEEDAQKQELGERVNLMRSRMNDMESEADVIRQQRHKEELAQQELGFNEKGIKDRLQQSYKIDYDEMLAQASQAADEASASEQEPFDPDTVEETLQKLRKRCDSYGNVNLAAMDEYEELKERFEFLTQQQADLLEAKSQLMKTINKINRTTRQLFMDTFTKVGEEFRIYFRMLFGGGEAQLVLLDPENVLESGIEIVARPPGKKLQSISLLSGGEKTLTAIALVFGVFKVNPSPFCILDEIDAALDESNVGRFSHLLKEFAQVAQFIVITHNRKTIECADVIYGVTMPETGISKVVSVKMAEEAKELVETAA